ncbi:Heavy metal-associated domain [Macleaya cordata]|uniref:Heavy metal-associated domain n=1 Tax=Macleaya cordata TaxID=56857 RepID=A0A200Q691_MACCD|nr:Heavy metal-associated domain [Macleaya cordata]
MATADSVLIKGYGLNFEGVVTVVLKVGMSCEGCSGAVKRVLNKTEGVESYDIDMKEQKVTVKTNLSPDVILQTDKLFFDFCV